MRFSATEANENWPEKIGPSGQASIFTESPAVSVHIRKIAKESIISVVGTLCGMLLSYVWMALGTRWLGPKDFGIFVLSQSICGIAVVLATLGMPKALDRYLPQFIAQRQFGEAKSLIRNLGLLALLSGSLTAGLIYVIASQWGSYPLSSALRVMTVSVPFAVVIEIFVYTFSGLKELRYDVWVKRITIPLASVVLGGAIILLRFKLTGWIWAFNISTALGLILAFAFFRSKVWPWLKAVPAGKIHLKAVLLYSFPLSLSGLLAFVLAQLEIIFLGRFSAMENVAVYRLYASLLALCYMVHTSIGRIYKPVFSGIVETPGIRMISQSRQEIYRRIARWSVEINSVALICLILFGNDVVALLFGSRYVTDPVAFRLLILAAFIGFATGPGPETLEAMGHSGIILLAYTVMVAVDASLCALLIPRFHLVGAAIANFSALTLANFFTALWLWWRYGLQPIDAKYTKVVLLSFAVVVGVYLSRISLISHGLALKVFAVFGAYAFGVWILKIYDREDVSLVQVVLAKLGVRRDLSPPS